MLSIWTRLLIVALVIPNCSAEEFGSLCIAPVFLDAKNLIAPGLGCDADKLSLKIDAQVMAWPLKSVKSDLNLTTHHRVMVLCEHKPQQSFIFRFSEFKTEQLCLFLGGYKTVQLWEAKRSPWCKCR